MKLVESVMDPAIIRSVRFYEDRVAFNLVDGGYIEIRVDDNGMLEVYVATEI